MLSIRRNLQTALLSALLILPVSALDYEAEIGAEGQFIDYEGESNLTLILDGGGAVRYEPVPAVDLNAEGAVELRYDTDGSFDAAEDITLRIDRLYGRWSGRLAGGRGLSVAGGRIGFRDPAGLVLDGPADGLSVALDDGRSLLSLQAGTTGLLFDDASPYFETDYEAARIDPFLGPSRLISLLRFEQAFGDRRRLAAVLAGSVDLVEEEPGVAFDGDLLDSFTLGFSLVDEPVPALTYRLLLYGQQSSYYGGGDREYLYTRGLALAAGAALAYEFEDALDSRIEAEFLFASGDDEHPLTDDAGGGISNQFMPVSVPDLGGIYPLALSNIVISTLRGSLQPLPTRSELRLQLGASAILRPAGGTGTLVPAADIAAPAGYLGSQLDLALDWQAAEGLDVGLFAGLFLPGGDDIAAALLPSTDAAVLVGIRGEYRLGTPDFSGERRRRRGNAVHAGLLERGTGRE